MKLLTRFKIQNVKILKLSVISSCISLFNISIAQHVSSLHVEAGLNTSTIALRFVGVDDKENSVSRGKTGPPSYWGI
jgi:hypothetical protein